MDKVRVIEDSIRYCKLSLWSLIPLFGLFALVRGFILDRSIAREVGQGWNPAAGYVFWGRIISLLCFSLYGFLAVGILIALLYPVLPVNY